MVARALWRSAYGSCRVSDQGTTLRASDLHNARATILNPFNTGHRCDSQKISAFQGKYYRPQYPLSI